MDDKQKKQNAIMCLIFLGIVFFVILFLAITNKAARAYIIAVLVIVAYCIIIKKLGGGKTAGEKLISQAIKDNTIVKAQQVGKIKYYPADTTSANASLRNDSYTATYEYIVNGRKYKYTSRFNPCFPDPEITLYYKSGKPQNAISHSSEKVGGSYMI